MNDGPTDPSPTTDVGFFESLLQEVDPLLDYHFQQSECGSTMMGAVLLAMPGGDVLGAESTRHVIPGKTCTVQKRRLWGPDEKAMGGFAWHEAPYCAGAIPAPLRLVLRSAYYGVRQENTFMFMTSFPEFEVTSMLVLSGVRAIIARRGVPSEGTQTMLKHYGVRWYVRGDDTRLSG